MKKTDKDQIKTSSVAELTKKVIELKKQISDETMKRQSSNVKNVHVAKTLRHKLAVVMSVRRVAQLTAER